MCVHTSKLDYTHIRLHRIIELFHIMTYTLYTTKKCVYIHTHNILDYTYATKKCVRVYIYTHTICSYTPHVTYAICTHTYTLTRIYIYALQYLQVPEKDRCYQIVGIQRGRHTHTIPDITNPLLPFALYWGY